jgi:hypothetical protein
MMGAVRVGTVLDVVVVIHLDEDATCQTSP